MLIICAFGRAVADPEPGPGSPGRGDTRLLSRELPVFTDVCASPLLIGRRRLTPWAPLSGLSTGLLPRLMQTLFPISPLVTSHAAVILGEAGPRFQLLGGTTLPHLCKWLSMYFSIHLLMFRN